MIKDLALRIIFIPLLGITLPLVSGIVTFNTYTFSEIIGAGIFFILSTYLIWRGCNWIHTRLRPLYMPIPKPFSTIAIVCAASAFYGACIGGLSAIIWLKISKEIFDTTVVYKFIVACIIVVIFFTLIYEILFLTKERELNTKIVTQLDKEISQAELQALTNEIDPHFIFNSLNTLNYLIIHQPVQAHLFNNKLAQVYKYFLINKNKELIPLSDELEFIESYVYLYQIRHDNKIQLEVILHSNIDHVMIPPYSIQILVENAIKHNEFTEKNPLLIRIITNEHSVLVSNKLKPKPYLVNSTGIGLKNLRSRYKIIFHKDIIIKNTPEDFIVTLPLIA